jgi:hypothetical protein
MRPPLGAERSLERKGEVPCVIFILFSGLFPQMRRREKNCWAVGVCTGKIRAPRRETSSYSYCCCLHTHCVCVYTCIDALESSMFQDTPPSPRLHFPSIHPSLLLYVFLLCGYFIPSIVYTFRRLYTWHGYREMRVGVHSHTFGSPLCRTTLTNIF